MRFGQYTRDSERFSVPSKQSFSTVHGTWFSYMSTTRGMKDFYSNGAEKRSLLTPTRSDLPNPFLFHVASGIVRPHLAKLALI